MHRFLVCVHNNIIIIIIIWIGLLLALGSEWWRRGKCSECPSSVWMLFPGCKTHPRRFSSSSSPPPIAGCPPPQTLAASPLSVHPLCTQITSQWYTSSSTTFVIGWCVLWMQINSFKRQSRLSWLCCSLSLSLYLPRSWWLARAVLSPATPPQPADSSVNLFCSFSSPLLVHHQFASRLSA